MIDHRVLYITPALWPILWITEMILTAGAFLPGCPLLLLGVALILANFWWLADDGYGVMTRIEKADAEKYAKYIVVMGQKHKLETPNYNRIHSLERECFGEEYAMQTALAPQTYNSFCLCSTCNSVRRLASISIWR